MNTETNVIRILTADDHALLRAGIASLVSIEPDMELVAQASTGREAIEQFRRHWPDITLMDLQMPDISGIEAIIAIRSEFPDAQGDSGPAFHSRGHGEKPRRQHPGQTRSERPHARGHHRAEARSHRPVNPPKVGYGVHAM
jgi:CheY-like chemotaxis protein